MKPSIFRAGFCLAVLAVTVIAKAQLGGPAPPDREPLRNGFLTAAESVLDDVRAVDLGDLPAGIDGRMAIVKTAQANLESMAESQREHIVVAKVSDVIFALQACRIAATDGQSPDACRARQARAESYALEAMGIHRDGNTWAAGAPR